MKKTLGTVVRTSRTDGVCPCFLNNFGALSAEIKSRRRILLIPQNKSENDQRRFKIEGKSMAIININISANKTMSKYG